MKTYQYLTIVAAMVLTFGACSTDAPETLKPGGANGDNEKVEFVSSIGDELADLGTESLDGASAAETRVTTTSDGAISAWETTDKISISDGALMYTYQPKEGSISGANCSFESKTSASFLTDGTGQDGTFYAFYPADAVQGWNGTTVTTMIYTEQKYSENVENSGVMGPYMAAVATTTDGGSKASFTFGHICSVIDVDLSSFNGGTVESVSLLSNSKASLAGRVKYNISSKAATVVNNDGTGYAASNCISDLVTVSEVGSTTPVVRFYVLPVRQTSGFTITVRTTDGNFYTKKSTTEVGATAVDGTYLASMSNQNGTACKPYYKKYNFGAIASATANLWMATIPSNLRLRQLTLPGAHDAATKNCGSASKCQSEDIAGLLANGVRGFDLRPRYTSSKASDIELDNLEIFHGSSSTGIKFKDAVATLVNFVKDNPSEMVVINMQKESSGGTDQSSTWRTSIRTCFQNNAAYLLSSLETYQNFGDARGKVVVISKNPYGSENVYSDVVYGGIIQETGDDTSTTSAYIYKQGGDKIVDASWEDRYGTTNTTNKQSYTKAMLETAAGDTSSRFYFTWNNIGYALFFGNPSDFANTMNPWLTTYLTTNAPANRLGFIYADFLGSSSYGGAALLKAIIQHNHKYVYQGRSRCSTTASSGTDTGVDISADEYANGGTVYVKHQGY